MDELFSKHENQNPDSCEFCPFVDYSKEQEGKQFCLYKQAYQPNNKQCDIPASELRKMLQGR